MKLLLDYLWRGGYSQIYLAVMVTYFVFCSLVIFAITSYRIDPQNRHTVHYVIDVLIFIVVLVFVVHDELPQLRNAGIGEYISQFSNMQQVLCYAMISSFVALDIFGPEESEWIEDAKAVSSACAGFGVVLGLLYYTRGIPEMGLMMRMFQEMVVQSTWFFVVLSVWMVAFFFAFWMLASDCDEDAVDCSLDAASGGGGRRGRRLGMEFQLTASQLTMTTIGQAVLASGLLAEFMNVDKIAVMNNQYKVFSWLFVYAMALVLSVVMLNLLIAIMNTNYTTILERVEIEEKRERFDMMTLLDCSIQARVLRKLNQWQDDCFHRYLLATLDRADIHSQEEKKERSSTDRVMDCFHDMNNRLTYMLYAIRDQETEITRQIATVQSQVEQTQCRVVRMERKLDTGLWPTETSDGVPASI
eukprot:gnl/TRDRNA2_/TRDRNA2_165562_c4_seq2.p1 gnl/TRDRNA2_/TRDRNA2_165562_c4~~gnl/TRDRNA2_/TRDRNA2_165562_c4_seq2.p1  ORF type:complete len:415 (-),score=35.32 gnl/TRDRNA2_/TRDRNA2_165562_c4_seq2:25-1269(-)